MIAMDRWDRVSDMYVLREGLHIFEMHSNADIHFPWECSLSTP